MKSFKKYLNESIKEKKQESVIFKFSFTYLDEKEDEPNTLILDIVSKHTLFGDQYIVKNVSKEEADKIIKNVTNDIEKANKVLLDIYEDAEISELKKITSRYNMK